MKFKPLKDLVFYYFLNLNSKDSASHPLFSGNVRPSSNVVSIAVKGKPG